MPTGALEMIADWIEECANVGDIDGFNLACKPPTYLRKQFTNSSTQTSPIQAHTKSSNI
jgi:hypothetical protein